VTCYLSLLVVARHRPVLSDDEDGARFRALVLWPYLGAGLVACLAGLLNPIDLTRRLLLPVASSFGACFGVTRIPVIDIGRSLRSGDAPLARLDRRSAWLAGMAIAIVWFIGMLGPGTR
jgi:hypothetical protein